MFKKVLIANRGEIAVRIGRGLRELGVSPVAIYSEADRGALHVRRADEAWCVGPAPSAESYLIGPRIIEAALASGAEAIHPGYGFLSENAAFAQAVIDAGLAWIGPPPRAIVMMGSKTLARATMQAAGVPVVPGSGAMSDLDEALAFACEAGFPVLIKAAAGGGGKGMRRVDRAEDFAGAFLGAQREAAASFKDDTVFIEKFVVEPKHVEFQLLSDAHGKHLHLLERDCSMQRRHQKVIEETPCLLLRPEVREAMGQVACRAAEAVDYVGAGTVEFLLDADQGFYFLEMNTRLQVEHPVTEMITGLDLVHWQVKIAAGEPITFDQSDVRAQGASIQCRIYAEDPSQNFMPSPGVIEHLSTPSGPGVRDDSGVESGAEVPMHYDPMVSKLVVWGADRPAAIARMKRALGEYVVRGIRTNISFHRALLEAPRFVDGTYDTQLISRDLDALLAHQHDDGGDELADLATAAAALAAFDRDTRARPGPSQSAAPSLDPWRLQGRLDRLRRT